MSDRQPWASRSQLEPCAKMAEGRAENADTHPDLSMEEAADALWILRFGFDTESHGERERANKNKHKANCSQSWFDCRAKGSASPTDYHNLRETRPWTPFPRSTSVPVTHTTLFLSHAQLSSCYPLPVIFDSSIIFSYFGGRSCHG